jgi:DNA-directed RNA polymerase specialized sigma24 family protein
MKTKLKTIQCPPYTREDFERDEEKRVKRTLVLEVDLGRIEGVPITRQDREVQRKIAVEPVGIRDLIAEQKAMFLQRMINSNLLSAAQKLCLELVLAGFRPIEVADLLAISNVTVHLHLKRAVSKLKRAYCKELLGVNSEV